MWEFGSDVILETKKKGKHHILNSFTVLYFILVDAQDIIFDYKEQLLYFNK